MRLSYSAAEVAARRAGAAIGQRHPRLDESLDLARELAADALTTGAGDDLMVQVLALEAMAGESVVAAMAAALHIGAAFALDGSPFGARLRTGALVGAIALSSEVVPGVDRNGRLTGRAMFVAPVTPSGVAVVGARAAEDGLVACAVALDAPGVSVSLLEPAGLTGLPCAHVDFDGCPTERVGATTPVMALIRTLVSAVGLGLGRRALREALVVARATGLASAGEQTVQGLLADAATELDAAMLLTWKAALRVPPSLPDASMAKLAVTEAAQGAVARATQVIGIETFSTGHVVAQLARDVRALELLAGRTEALRDAVAEVALAD